MKREYNRGEDRKTERLEIRVSPEQKRILLQVTKTIGWGTAIGIIAGLIDEERKERHE